MINPIEDELAIRHLVSAYADAVNRRDESLWTSTWADACEWTLPGAGTFSGKEAVVGLWVQAMSGFDFVVQLTYQGTLEIEGGQATGRWYLCEHLRPKGSKDGMFNIGCYSDEYIKQDGQWYFSKRDYQILYNDEGKGNMSGMVIPFSS